MIGLPEEPMFTRQGEVIRYTSTSVNRTTAQKAAQPIRCAARGLVPVKDRPQCAALRARALEDGLVDAFTVERGAALGLFRGYAEADQDFVIHWFCSFNDYWEV